MEPVRNIESAKAGKSAVINLEKGKLPPQAVDLEEAVLGSLMIDRNALDDIMTIIKTPDVFYKEAHKHIFEAIQSLYQKNLPIDLLTVSQKLRETLKLENVGGEFYLIQLTQKISSSAHAEYHCRILLQQHVKRQLIKVSSEMIANAYDDDSDIFDLLAKGSLVIDALSEQTSAGANDITQKEALQKIQDKIEILSSKKSDDISGVKTGFKRLDLVTSGWQWSDLIVIAARPGMGKTSFVLKVMLENIKINNPVGVVSLEMSTIQLVTRLVACNSHFHLNQLFRHGFEHTKYFQQFVDLKQEMEKYPGYYDDRSTDVYDVIAKIRKWHRVHGIKMAIIDYLQLMSCKSLGRNAIREQEIATITRLIKKLAKELNIPILLLSQLSRDVESRGSSKKPMLKDLRESGAIEQDADVVAFIYRPEYYGIEDDELQSKGANTEFIIAKHRNGSLDSIALYFDSNKTKFMDPEDRQSSDESDREMKAMVNELPKPTANEAFGSGNNYNDAPF
jgi:replicative DNA helicase